MAYAFSDIYRVLENLQPWEASMNEKGNELGCNPSGDAEIWRALWATYGKAANHQGNVDGVGFELDETDFWNVNHSLGTRLSCAKIAATLNELLRAAGCCHRFACKPDEGVGWVFAPEEELDAVFE